MTRKEAINILEHLTPPKHYDENDAYYIGQALSMAIEALEQEPTISRLERRIDENTVVFRTLEGEEVEYVRKEPCEAIRGSTYGGVSWGGIYKPQVPCDDVVSRQAAIDTIESWLSCDDYNEAERHIMRAMQSVLYDLPYVRPQEPCEDAVSREELLKAISTWDKFGCDANTKLVPYQDHYIPYIHYDDVIKCIKGMPPVRPQEPKTGHWIDKHEDWNEWTCSGCGFSKITDIHIRLGYNYCPNCGAKMVEPQESEVRNDRSL